MRSLLAACILMVGCGADVTIGGGAGPGGASATGGASGSSSGNGGNAGFNPSSSSSSSSSSGEPTCPIVTDEITYYLAVLGDDDPEILTHGCDLPYAYVVMGGGGECGPAGARIVACDPDIDRWIRILAPNLSEPGTIVDGQADYVSAEGVTCQALGVVVSLDDVGPVGAATSGYYQATMTDCFDPNNDDLAIEGDFSLCRLPDLPPCP